MESALIAIPEAVARPKIEVVRSVDDALSIAGKGGPILAVRINRKRLATLGGLFSAASLGMIAHYLLLTALAVRDPLPGDGTDGSIATFVASQEQLLSRALITTRLGKTPAPDSVGAALPAFPPALATHADRRSIRRSPLGGAMLFRGFQASEVMFVRRMLLNDKAAPFMRPAQLLVGLCANDAVLADAGERHDVCVALTAYAALATAEISRIFLRAKLSRAPDFFKATDGAFDDAAKTPLDQLRTTVAHGDPFERIRALMNLADIAGSVGDTFEDASKANAAAMELAQVGYLDPGECGAEAAMDSWITTASAKQCGVPLLGILSQVGAW